MQDFGLDPDGLHACLCITYAIILWTLSMSKVLTEGDPEQLVLDELARRKARLG